VVKERVHGSSFVGCTRETGTAGWEMRARKMVRAGIGPHPVIYPHDMPGAAAGKIAVHQSPKRPRKGRGSAIQGTKNTTLQNDRPGYRRSRRTLCFISAPVREWLIMANETRWRRPTGQRVGAMSANVTSSRSLAWHGTRCRTPTASRETTTTANQHLPADDNIRQLRGRRRNFAYSRSRAPGSADHHGCPPPDRERRISARDEWPPTVQAAYIHAIRASHFALAHPSALADKSSQSMPQSSASSVRAGPAKIKTP